MYESLANIFFRKRVLENLTKRDTQRQIIEHLALYNIEK